MKPTQSWQELIFQRGRKAKEEYNKAFIGKTRPSSAASDRTSEAAAALAAREAAIAARAQELKEKMAALKAAKDAGDISVAEYAQAISKLRQEHQAAEQAAEAARKLEETTQEYLAREQELAKRLSKGGSPPSAAELAPYLGCADLEVDLQVGEAPVGDVRPGDVPLLP
jgi:ABC-type transporter Mla subunit MlaD